MTRPLKAFIRIRPGDISISTQIIAGYLLVLLAVGALAVARYYVFEIVSNSVGAYARHVDTATIARELDGDVAAYRHAVRAFTLLGQDEDAAAAEALLTRIRRQVSDAEGANLDPEDRARLADIAAEMEIYAKLYLRAAAVLNNEDVQTTELDPLGQQLRPALENLFSEADSAGERGVARMAFQIFSQSMRLHIRIGRLLDRYTDASAEAEEKSEIESSIATLGTALDGLGGSAPATLRAQVLKVQALIQATVQVYRELYADKLALAKIANVEMAAVADRIVKDAHLIAQHSAAEEARLQRDAFALTSEAQSVIFQATLLSLGLGLLIAGMVARRISLPVTRMSACMLALSRGDLGIDIPVTGGRNELGRMADAVEIFKRGSIENERLRRQQNAAVAEAAAAKKALLEELAGNFERSVSGVVTTVTAAAGDMQATAQSMTASAVQAQSQSSAVANAASNAAENVQTVATAAEQLSSTIVQIGHQVTTATHLVGAAAETGRRADATVQGLSRLANQIGEVVSLISNIASQTNLLALNATIEAARAGDAGRGFAVVAAEVKALASQTARATDQIRSQIGAIQSETKSAVEAIRLICDTIGEVHEISSTIAAAIEEQTSATQEIARNVYQASLGTEEVSAHIVGVSAAADVTGAAAGLVLDSSSSLSSQAEKLRQEVDNFITHLRAA